MIKPLSSSSRVQPAEEFWQGIHALLNDTGYAVIPELFNEEQSVAVKAWYPQASLFRKRIVMERHNFGSGEYQYFAYPLPKEIEQLRTVLYPHLAPIANDWYDKLNIKSRFPDTHAEFVARCHRAGQKRPTPLLLKYGPGDYNCLHQDLYGEQVFPLQMVVQLSKPGKDFEGGEFVVTEQRPRMQSRASVIPLRQGDAAIFAVSVRPRLGKRGYYRLNMRHGVSEVTQGERFTLGIIFHDAT